MPIDYTEVSITRRMFRSGDSEYEINGSSCRLLDIQELLSDSGIGREMHVIVGQGQLDAVLHAKPEDRRAFIEEAAGVLKHRKRKEKALRKLDAMQTNLNRLTDLTAELRRQLKPLGRQAEVARRAATIQADLRDARLRLLADDLATLRATLDKEIADETALRERREQVEQEHTEVQRRLAELELALAEDAPLLASAQDNWYRLAALQERFRSTEQLASERLRHLNATPDDERPGRDPERLVAEAEEIRAHEEELRAALTDDQVRLAEAVESRQELERQLAEAERALVAAAKAIADRREGLARLTGQVNSARARTGSAAEEIDRLAAAHADAAARAEQAQAELDAVAERSSQADRNNADLDARHAEAVAAHEAANAAVRAVSDAERAAEKDAATWKAREEALAMGLRRKDGAGALLGPGGPGARAARRVGRAADRGAGPRGGARRRARSARRRGGDGRRRRGDRGDPTAQDPGRRPSQPADRPIGRARHDRFGGRPASRAASRCAMGAGPGRLPRRDAPGGAPGVARRGPGRRSRSGDPAGRRPTRNCARSPATAT